MGSSSTAYQDQAASARRHQKVVVGTDFGQARAIYVGVGGIVVVKDLDGTLAAYKNVANGQVLSVQCLGVVASGDGATTTATDMIAWF